MTNGEKFRTAKERLNAFESWCKCTNCGRCEGCEIKYMHLEYKDGLLCPFLWLELEVKEEKAMPCPFCNNEYVEVGKAAAGMREVTCICGYRSPAKESEAEAIAVHNRLCKSVTAYKEGEVK